MITISTVTEQSFLSHIDCFSLCEVVKLDVIKNYPGLLAVRRVVCSSLMNRSLSILTAIFQMDVNY